MKFKAIEAKANEVAAFNVVSDDGQVIGRVSSRIEVEYKLSNGNRYANGKVEKTRWSAFDINGKMMCSEATSRKYAASFIK